MADWKKRAGYHPITLGGVDYLYKVSLATHSIYLYPRGAPDNRIVLDMSSVAIPYIGTWRGKHRDGGWGKSEVAHLINYYLGQEVK